MKAKTESFYEQQLFAIVALLGIDEALAILQRERERIVSALNGNRYAMRRMTLNDFVTALSRPVPAQRASASPKPAPKALPPAPKAQVEAPKERMRSALKTELARGPRGIANIVKGLKRQGVVADTSPETKKHVMAFLAHDKTFSIRTRGVYAIRTRQA